LINNSKEFTIEQILLLNIRRRETEQNDFIHATNYRSVQKSDDMFSMLTQSSGLYHKMVIYRDGTSCPVVEDQR
jgi:hypothetical protein